MIDIIADNPFDAELKQKDMVIKHLQKEILRLKQKCGEQFTVENLMGDFGQPKGFNIKRSENWG